MLSFDCLEACDLLLQRLQSHLLNFKFARALLGLLLRSMSLRTFLFIEPDGSSTLLHIQRNFLHSKWLWARMLFFLIDACRQKLAYVPELLDDHKTFGIIWLSNRKPSLFSFSIPMILKVSSLTIWTNELNHRESIKNCFKPFYGAIFFNSNLLTLYFVGLAVKEMSITFQYSSCLFLLFLLLYIATNLFIIL